MRLPAASAAIVVAAALASCAPGYSSYDPYDEYDEVTDLSSREEIREVEGEFWCNGYGDYFAPDGSDEIWCTFGGGLCMRFEEEIDDALERGVAEDEICCLKAVLSGNVGAFIDEYYELDCSRTFFVTNVHWLRLKTTRVYKD